MSLESITKQIKDEIEKLSKVLRLLEGGVGRKAKRAKTTGPTRRKMSGASRKKIADAQRARWAKFRAGKK